MDTIKVIHRNEFTRTIVVQCPLCRLDRDFTTEAVLARVEAGETVIVRDACSYEFVVSLRTLGGYVWDPDPPPRG